MTESKGLSPENIAAAVSETAPAAAVSYLRSRIGDKGTRVEAFKAGALWAVTDPALASRSTSKPVGVEDEDLAAVAGLPSSQGGSDPQGEHSAGLRDISTAPRDGTPILARMSQIDDESRWTHLSGRWFVVRHDGQTVSDYDMGWSVYPGLGGAPDGWFDGWLPLPAQDDRIATAWHDGFIAALGCRPWEAASDFAILVGQQYARGEALPPTMPRQVLAAEPWPPAESSAGQPSEASASALTPDDHTPIPDPIGENPGGWQDIASAPPADHMNTILIAWKSRGVCESYWDVDDDFADRPMGWRSPECGWRSPGDQCIPVDQENCTHWMPLPAPPPESASRGLGEDHGVSVAGSDAHEAVRPAPQHSDGEDA